MANAFDFLAFVPKNKIGAITIAATLEESHTDTLRTTEHPVEANAPITDHAFVEPPELILKCGWSNSSVDALVGALQSLFSGGAPSVSDYVSSVYSQLLTLQQSRQPFAVITGTRKYSDMLMTRLQVTRDRETSAALLVTATFRHVILVSTQSTTLPADTKQASPQKTAETSNGGAKQLQSVTPSPGGAVAPASM